MSALKELSKMKTITSKGLTKVETWLPVFSGFYETIWDGDSDAEMELAHINEVRAEKGLAALDNDNDIDWDYEGYSDDVVRGVTKAVGDALIAGGYIKGYTFQKLNSPREYNFANDSVNVVFTLNKANHTTVAKYLASHHEAFKEYLEARYTSYDGFCSSYSPSVDVWMADIDNVLCHGHQLGSVLNFILLHEDPQMEMDIYENLSGNGVNLQATNYEALISEPSKAVR